MRFLIVTIIALAIVPLAACKSEAEERSTIAPDYSDAALWARVWLIERTVQAENADDFDEWLSATSSWDLFGPCGNHVNEEEQSSYLDLPEKRDREAFRRACNDLGSLFNKHDTHDGSGFRGLTEAEESEVDGIMYQHYLDMGYE